MSRYSEAFRNHPAHDRLRQIADELDAIPKDLRKTAEQQEPKDTLRRLEEVLKYVETLLGAVDPTLVTEAMLNGIDNPLQQISSGLTPLKDSQDFTQLSTIDGNTEGLLNAAVQVAPALGVWAQTDVKKAASALGKAAKDRTREIDSIADNLETRLGEVREQLEQTSTQIKDDSDQRLTEIQTQLDSIKTEADTERTRIQESIDGFQAQFTAEQESRGVEFETLKGELGEKSDAVAQELREKAEASATSFEAEAAKVREGLEERGNATIKSLEGLRGEAAALVDLVATSSTAGAFGKEAEAQKAEADKWRDRAIGLGIAAGVVALIGIGLSIAFDTSVSLVVAKIAAVALLLGIAGYAAGQSGQHRRREQRAKRLELELVAFGPFTEPLDDEKKQTVRVSFIERMFVGDPGEEGQAKDDGISEENLSALAKLIDLIRPSS